MTEYHTSGPRNVFSSRHESAPYICRNASNLPGLASRRLVPPITIRSWRWKNFEAVNSVWSWACNYLRETAKVQTLRSRVWMHQQPCAKWNPVRNNKRLSQHKQFFTKILFVFEALRRRVVLFRSFGSSVSLERKLNAQNIADLRKLNVVSPRLLKKFPSNFTCCHV